MANEKRLIDANALLEDFGEEPVVWNDGEAEIQERNDWRTYTRMVQNAPTVDAVEANKYEELVCKYEELVGMYHELRENFVDYVCSGIRNEAPYCLNKCEDCVDQRGWCKFEKCQGFNPAEVILYRFAKMDGDGMAENYKNILVNGLKHYHDCSFTPGVYGHSIVGQAALLLEKSEEVVRCKDCVHRKERVCANPCYGMWVVVELKDDDFCSYGERRNDV